MLSTPVGARRQIARCYHRATARSGGRWQALVTVAEPDGTELPAVEQDPDEVVEAYSVNKVALAVAVLDKIDRGELRLSDKVTLTPEIIAHHDGGIYHLHRAWGDQITLGNVMTALLLVSDDTAVRLCGLVCPGPEVNEILAAKGFAHTRVEPLPADPRRMFLGVTTPRETHTLLARLAAGTLVSADSTEFLLSTMCWTSGYHDGIRHDMSSNERLRIATKYGALETWRNEAGIMFDEAGAALVIYSFFATLSGHDEDMGATHPLVRAHARLGRAMFDAIQDLPAPRASARR